MDTVSEFHANAPQATASDGLAQGPYIVARAGFEPATFRRKASNLPMSHHVPQPFDCLDQITAYETMLLVRHMRLAICPLKDSLTYLLLTCL